MVGLVSGLWSIRVWYIRDGSIRVAERWYNIHMALFLSISMFHKQILPIVKVPKCWV